MMSKKKEYYKVVTNDLKSIITSTTSTVYGVQYKVGEYVEPILQNTQLFVFNDYESAVQFTSKIYRIYCRRIFKCKIKNPSKITLYIANCWSDKLLNKILKIKRDKKKYTQLLPKAIDDPLPSNTIGASAVMLMEEIKP